MRRFSLLRMSISITVGAVALAGLGSAVPATALVVEPPVLQNPIDGSTIDASGQFSVDTPGEGYVRVEYATDDDFGSEDLVCESGWFHTGLHTTIEWGHPGPLWNTDVTCLLGAGTYFWRVQWGGIDDPPDEEGPWSEISSFTLDIALYTWEDAVDLELPGIEDYQDPGDVDECVSVDFTPEELEEEPPDNATECFLPPEEQGLLLAERTDELPEFIADETTAGSNYRHTGSSTSLKNFKGGKNLSEVSNPSICHASNCNLMAHFYSRIAGITTGGHAMELGWIEADWNDPDNDLDTGDDQKILSVFQAWGSSVQNKDFHTNFTVNPGGAYAFRIRDCSNAQRIAVCYGFWDGNQWVRLRTKTGVKCMENGAGKCLFNFLQEPFVSNGSSWFNINGGSDGLRMRDIRLWEGGSWNLLNPGDHAGYWTTEVSPYSRCEVHNWYHFTFFRGSPSC